MRIDHESMIFMICGSQNTIRINGSVKVAACASTSDSAAVQGGYACICGATLQTQSRGDRVVMVHGMGSICQIIADRGEDLNVPGDRDTDF